MLLAIIGTTRRHVEILLFHLFWARPLPSTENLENANGQQLDEPKMMQLLPKNAYAKCLVSNFNLFTKSCPN